MVLTTLNTFFDMLFSPFLYFSPLTSIAVVSLLLSLLVTIIYKYMTDQQLMKTLKEETAQLQKQMKTLKEHPEKMLEVQKKAMEANMKYMTHSMKPTLITFLPLILIFGWLSAHYQYQPILPQEEFTVDVYANETINAETPVALKQIKTEKQNDKTTFTFKAEKEGVYLVRFLIKDKKYDKKIRVSNKQNYETPETTVEGTRMVTNQKELRLLNLYFWKPTWIGTYIIFSIVFSLGLRRAMKIY